MPQQFVIKTANGKFMSEIYTMNGLDFETMYEADAKKFDTKEEAQSFIDESGFEKDFVYVASVAENE